MAKKSSKVKDPNVMYFDEEELLDSDAESFEEYIKNKGTLNITVLSTFKHYLNFFDTLGAESGRIAKAKLISDFIANKEHYTDIRNIIHYAYNPYLRYNTTSIAYDTTGKPNLNIALNYLLYLSSKNGSSNKEIEELGKLCSVDEETCELFNRIVRKDLREGAGVKTWKSFFPDLPEHGVMLCEDDIEGFLKLANNDFSKISWSLKLDGVRCTAIIDGNNVKFLSRNGLEYKNFGIFEKDLIELSKTIIKGNSSFNYPMIFDGEVISKDRDFTNTMSQLKRIEKLDSSIFEFHIFDIFCDLTFIERYQLLDAYLIDNKGPVFKKLRLVEHYCIFDDQEPVIKCKNGKEIKFSSSISSKSDLIHISDILCDNGEEGIVCKLKDSLYEKKRSKAWCKIKKFHTIELNVVDVEEGTGRNAGVLGALICVLPNNNLVKVGSGYDDAQRKEFWTDPPKMIEVKYQEKTEDSIRFPVFIRVREDK